jgi:ubiquinone/menaquinone biosynthesis C-methylase UbiE
MSTLTQKTYSQKGIGMEGWIASWYTTNTGKDLHQFQTLARRITAELPSGSRILEVAAGPGLLAVELAKSGYNQVVALDSSRSSVETARQNADREGVAVRVRQGDYSAMPFPDARFDRIVCRTALKSFSRPLEVLMEMHRVLKPGGRAVMIDLNLPSRLFTKLAFRTMLRKRAYTPERFQQLVAQSGFSKLSVEEKEIGFEAWIEKEPDQTELAQPECRRMAV